LAALRAGAPAGCAPLPPPPQLAPAVAAAPAPATHLDRANEPLEVEHPNASGFVVLAQARAAFAARARITDLAERSLDVQTYIWHADLTGNYLASELLRAADRGVRVRLLLDDLDARSRNDQLLALDAHEGIDVRLFNPLPSRRGKAAAAGDFASSFRRLNRRMHIKNWIADNRVAIAGGRNVGDEYFGASAHVNFADSEFLMVGPVVRQGTAEFDRFWNSTEVYPITTLNPDAAEANRQLEQMRVAMEDYIERARNSDYADELREDALVGALVGGRLSLVWTTGFQLAADDPSKANPDAPPVGSDVLRMLLPRMRAAQRDVLIVSPYFVPGDEGTRLLVGLAGQGIRVRVLTNSLAANDVAAVHGGYSRHRKALLEGGVELWELKPFGTAQDHSLLGSSGASLHAKALTIDDDGLFIGSYNLDPRSTELNAEMGVYVESAPLAGEFRDRVVGLLDSNMAWRVQLERDKLTWTDASTTVEREPDASIGRRFQAWLARLLPLDHLL
jgi:putative cardiolipin synthase